MFLETIQGKVRRTKGVKQGPCHKLGGEGAKEGRVIHSIGKQYSFSKHFLRTYCATLWEGSSEPDRTHHPLRGRRGNGDPEQLRQLPKVLQLVEADLAFEARSVQFQGCAVHL